MQTGHGFTVQGRLDSPGDDDAVDGLLAVLEAAGAVEPAVSVGPDYVGVTAYFYARDAEHALELFGNILPTFNHKEVL